MTCLSHVRNTKRRLLDSVPIVCLLIATLFLQGTGRCDEPHPVMTHETRGTCQASVRWLMAY